MTQGYDTTHLVRSIRTNVCQPLVRLEAVEDLGILLTLSLQRSTTKPFASQFSIRAMSAPVGKCPFVHVTAGARANKDWWPKVINLGILHQHSSLSNPMGEAFNYAQEFKTLNMPALQADLTAMMTDSKDWCVFLIVLLTVLCYDYYARLHS